MAIKFSLNESKLVQMKTNSVSSTTEVGGTVDVPTSGTGTTTSSIDATGETSSSADTFIQYTSFKITVNSAYTYNQQFTDVNKMKAVLRVDDSVTSDVTITKDDNNNIFINVYWSGSLNDKFVNKKDSIPLFDSKNTEHDCYLYVSMPNKLIYSLNFKLQGNGETGATVSKPN